VTSQSLALVPGPINVREYQIFRRDSGRRVHRSVSNLAKIASAKRELQGDSWLARGRHP
jgi:hypothetical protein